MLLACLPLDSCFSCSQFCQNISHEIDYILGQEGLKYADQLQTVGANIKQFCSDIVRDVQPQPTEDTLDGVASDSCLVKNTESDKKSKEGIVQNHFDMEPCNVSHLLYSCSVEPVKATKYDLSLEEMIVAENLLLLRTYQPEPFDAPEDKDLSISVLSSTSYDLLECNSITETIPIHGLSSKSINLVDSYESKVPDLGFTSREASAEPISKYFLLLSFYYSLNIPFLPLISALVG